MSKRKTEVKIFAVSPAQEKEVDLYCFGSCGKIIVGAITICGGTYFPCGQDICPHEEKRTPEPIGKIKSQFVYVRKLRQVAHE
jgi:hypothetical protein